MTETRTAATSTRQLHWNAENRQYVGEISSTNGFGRAYDDACDEGMTLVSATTGEEAAFVVSRTVRDAEGDVVSWLLVPVSGGPRLAGVTVLLFND